MILFKVTYETITPESAERGDWEDFGFVSEEGVRLREAINLMGGIAFECSYSSGPFGGCCLINHKYGHGTRDYYQNGREESRSLHIPESVTDSSARRIARLLRMKV